MEFESARRLAGSRGGLSLATRRWCEVRLQIPSAIWVAGEERRVRDLRLLQPRLPDGRAALNVQNKVGDRRGRASPHIRRRSRNLAPKARNIFQPFESAREFDRCILKVQHTAM